MRPHYTALCLMVSLSSVVSLLMKDIELEELGALLDGELEENERVKFSGCVRVIGESATDILYSYRGSASIKGRTGPTYEGREDDEYVLYGSGSTFIFRPETVAYRAPRSSNPRRKGHDERLTVNLADPEHHRMLIEDCDSIIY